VTFFLRDSVHTLIPTLTNGAMHVVSKAYLTCISLFHHATLRTI